MTVDGIVGDRQASHLCCDHGLERPGLCTGMMVCQVYVNTGYQVSIYMQCVRACVRWCVHACTHALLEESRRGALVVGMIWYALTG